jgi:hypothetical protein
VTIGVTTTGDQGRERGRAGRPLERPRVGSNSLVAGAGPLDRRCRSASERIDVRAQTCLAAKVSWRAGSELMLSDVVSTVARMISVRRWRAT